MNVMNVIMDLIVLYLLYEQVEMPEPMDWAPEAEIIVVV